MAKGMNVTCGRCTGRFNIYEDISKTYGKETVVSVCPHCGNVEGHFFKREFTFDYNAGDGEHGVPAKEV